MLGFKRALYTLAMYLLTPVILYRLMFRGIRNRGYLSRWAERFGVFEAPQWESSIWLHAVSVGEFNAAIPLVDELLRRHPSDPIVITTITPTGSDRVRKIYGDRVFHVYLPYDLPAAIRRFFARVKPRIALIMETEIWPNLYFECRDRAIPIVLANARLSERSLRGYGPVQSLATEAVRCIEMIAAQSRIDAERFLRLGAHSERMQVLGNVKFDMPVPRGLDTQAEEFRRHWGRERPVWIAASTHEGEEAAVLQAHARVLGRFPDALLILVPRHPERFRSAIALCRSYGFRTTCRSEDSLAAPDSQCFVVDSMGELLRFYACADACFVGGSLDRIGGHNVLEPAALAKPVITGPHTFNFAEITDILIDEGGAIRVQNGAGLGHQIIRILHDPSAAQAMGAAALKVVERERGAAARIMDVVEQVMAGGSGLRRLLDDAASAS